MFEQKIAACYFVLFDLFCLCFTLTVTASGKNTMFCLRAHLQSVANNRIRAQKLQHISGKQSAVRRKAGNNNLNSTNRTASILFKSLFSIGFFHFGFVIVFAVPVRQSAIKNKLRLYARLVTTTKNMHALNTCKIPCKFVTRCGAHGHGAGSKVKAKTTLPTCCVVVGRRAMYIANLQCCIKKVTKR